VEQNEQIIFLAALALVMTGLLQAAEQKQTLIAL